jgi:toxin ParE1/3/4
MYRATPNGTIEIVRILHDRMDLQRHVPSASDESTR